MHVALNGQWSGMPSFSLIIYSQYLGKSVSYVNIWLHNGLQVLKSIILGRRNGGVLFFS